LSSFPGYSFFPSSVLTLNTPPNTHNHALHRAPIAWILAPWCIGYLISIAIGIPLNSPFWWIALTVNLLAVSWLCLTRTIHSTAGFTIWKLLFLVAACMAGATWWQVNIASDAVIKTWKGLAPREMQLVIRVDNVLRPPGHEPEKVVEFEGHVLNYAKPLPVLRALKSVTCSLMLPDDTENIHRNDIITATGCLYPPDSPYHTEFEFRNGNIEWIQLSPTKGIEIDRVRQWVLNRMIQTLESGVPEGRPYAGYIQSMITGDKRFLGHTNKNRIRDAGVMHYFAISGFHLSVVALICLSAFQLIGFPRPLAIGSMLAFSSFYVWLTGSPVSAQRALIMLLCYFGAQWLNRKPDAFAAVATAGWFIVLIDPPQLFTPGFQLSFVVVIGIVTQSPALFEWLTRKTHEAWRPELKQNSGSSNPAKIISDYFIASISVSWTAFWLSAPIVACHFGRVPFSAIILNTLLAPLFALAMISGFLSSMLGLAGFLSQAAFLNHALWVILAVVEFSIGMSEHFSMLLQVETEPFVSTLGVLVMIMIGCIVNLKKSSLRPWLAAIPIISISSILLSNWLSMP